MGYGVRASRASRHLVVVTRLLLSCHMRGLYAGVPIAPLTGAPAKEMA